MGLGKDLLSRVGVGIGNNNEYPIQSNSYFVIFGTSITSFSKISGITLKSSDVIAITEGGSNKPYLLKQAKGDFNTITFEKGYGTMELMSMAKGLKTANIMMIIIKGPDKAIKAAYYTDRAMVKNITLSDLDAEQSRPLIQSMTVVYNELKKADDLIISALSLLNGLGGSGGTGVTTVDEAMVNVLERDKEESKRRKEEAARKKAEEKVASVEPKVTTLEQDRIDARKKKEEQETQPPTSTPIDSAVEKNTLINEEAAKKEEEEKEKALKEREKIESQIEL